MYTDWHKLYFRIGQRIPKHPGAISGMIRKISDLEDALAIGPVVANWERVSRN